jgi:hypothetical protein
MPHGLSIIPDDVWYACDPFFNRLARTDTRSVETIPLRTQIMKRTIVLGISLTALAFNTLVSAQSLPQSSASLYAEDGSYQTVDKMINRQTKSIEEILLTENGSDHSLGRLIERQQNRLQAPAQLAEDGTEQTIDKMINRQQHAVQPQLAEDGTEQTIDKMINRQQHAVQPQLAEDGTEQTIDRSHHRMHRLQQQFA